MLLAELAPYRTDEVAALRDRNVRFQAATRIELLKALFACGNAVKQSFRFPRNRRAVEHAKKLCADVPGGTLLRPREMRKDEAMTRRNRTIASEPSLRQRLFHLSLIQSSWVRAYSRDK